MSRRFLTRGVPVAPILAALGRDPDERGRYFCPWHDDETTGRPSADVWGDGAELLGCWSCARNGTAVDVVVAVTGHSEDWATEFVDRVRTTTPPLPARRLRRELAPEVLEAELGRLTTGVRYPRDVEPVGEFVGSRLWGPYGPLSQPESGAFARYARDSWGWVGDYRGRVVLPHRDAGGRLRGLRFRVPPDWRKDGRRDSRFRQLYGAWRLGQVRGAEVWLCEGETDTVWVAYHLEPTGVAVFGAPSAAYVTPDAADLGRFFTRVVLAFDGDAAGVAATERWLKVLDPAFAEIVVVKPQPGADLAQCDVGQLWRSVRG
ncbi:MAG: hypothetical protein ACRDHK_04680 [Actinomycetota bacterium]